MKQLFLTLSLVVAASITSCQKEDTTRVTSPSASFTVKTEIVETKSVSKEAWADEDSISVWAWVSGSTIVNGVTNTYDAATKKWTPSSYMLWKDMSSVHNFTASFPVQNITNFSAHSYTLLGNGAASDDFLVAVNNAADLSAENYSTVPLEFEHMTSKVTISLSFRDQFDTTPSVSEVNITAKNNAEVDILNQTTSATGSAVAFKIAETTANTNYEGVIIPQGIQYINIVIGSDTYTYDHGSVFTLVQGKNHTISLTVGKDKVELDGDSITIGSWQPGDSITDGDAEKN
ncbi:MAG: fimbrillin family protein [Rikenellaceae bacterium]